MRFFSSAEAATGSFVWMPDNYLHKKRRGRTYFLWHPRLFCFLFLSFCYSSSARFEGHGFL